jgi:RNA polymerase-binding transcription factor DksA
MVGEATAEYCEAVSDERSKGSSEYDVSDSSPVSQDDAIPSGSADLDTIESDLAAVETALNRLDAGTYWTDEVTGEPLPEAVLEENPLLRRLPR